ncbi:MAG: VCBS repeat-containing protein [Myxococcales bacterium]|nr:VCBS repeat-containing protein [Myxococcales bacterium]
MRRGAWFGLAVAMALGALAACGGDDSTGGSGTGGSGTGGGGTGGSSGGGGMAGGGGSGNAGGGGTGNTGGATNPTCEKGTSAGPVQAPTLWKNLKGETSWFASPLVVDLDKDGKNELVAAYYSLFVYDSQGTLVSSAKDGSGRVYAPHVVADLDGDGTTEIVVGNGKNVIAYEWKAGKLAMKAGWPADTTTAGNAPEVRGLAAADLNGDGKIEVVATTTQTASTKNGGAQVFVYSPDGKLYQPAGASWQAWPRYNNKTGTGNDADRNGMGHSGYGCYGLNVGIGNIDDDPALEILATYDNHHIQAFDHDGVAIDSAPWFKNRDSKYANQRLTWGQFIRWADPKVESDHYHDHTGQWPHPSWAEWLQWTASPPNVVDLDQDGKNEVVGVPNVEKNEPYETQAYAVMALEGIYGDGSRSAMRKPGWEALPRGGKPISVSGYYPPGGVPAPATIDLQGDKKPEVIVSLNDGHMYAFDAGGKQLWKFNYLFGKAIMYASEPIVADLNQDGSPEVLFSTFGDPDTTDSGHLVILAQDGALLHDVKLPNPGHNGNGNGAPAAPAVGDLDGDGVLEVFVQTFEHGMDIFKVPGSGTKCLLWPTARGGRLRMGQPSQ